MGWMAKKRRYEHGLILSDAQSPFEHPDYVSHALYVKKQFNCTFVINVNDMFDYRFLGKFGIDPNDPMSPNEQHMRALDFKKRLQTAFPVMWLCHCNHSARVQKRAQEAMIPTFMLKSLEQIMEFPKGWKLNRFVTAYKDQVIIEHGTRASGGVDGALKLAIKNHRSTVIGHHSSKGGVLYQNNGNTTVFGLNVGGMVDDNSWGMQWGKDFQDKTTLGHGVILSPTEAHFVPLR